MSNKPQCEICTLEVGDNAYVCKKCSNRLDRDLGEISSLVAEVETTSLRQSRTAATSGIGIVMHVREEDRPLPYNDKPRLALRELTETLHGFTRLIVTTRGVPEPVDSPFHMARFLLRHTEWLRHQTNAADAQRELQWAIHTLRKSIDLPQDRVFAGPCGAVDYTACTIDHDHTDPAACDSQPIVGSPPCTGSVFGSKRNSEKATCDICGCVHVMADRRGWLLKAIEDQLDYAARLSQALSNLGREVNAATIRKWAERGRLVAHGHDDHNPPRPLYRVGDVMDLIAADAARQARGKAS